MAEPSRSLTSSSVSTSSSSSSIQFEKQEELNEAERKTAPLSRSLSRTFSGILPSFRKSAEPIAQASGTLRRQVSKVETLKTQILTLKKDLAQEKSTIKSQIAFVDSYQKLKFESSLQPDETQLKQTRQALKNDKKELKSKLKKLESKASKLSEKSSEASIAKLESVITQSEATLNRIKAHTRIPPKFQAFVEYSIKKGGPPKAAQKIFEKNPQLVTAFLEEVAHSSAHGECDLHLLNSFGEKALAQAVTKNPELFTRPLSQAYAKEGVIPDKLLQHLEGHTKEAMTESVVNEISSQVKQTGELPKRPDGGLSLEHQEVFGRVFKNILNSDNTVVTNMGGGSGGVMKIGIPFHNDTKWLYVMKTGSFDFKDKVSEQDKQQKEEAGFKNGQEDMRELVSNVGFFGARNMAAVNVPANTLREGQEGEARVVVMDFVQSEGTLQDLLQHRYTSIDLNFITPLSRDQVQTPADFRDLDLPRGVTKEDFHRILSDEMRNPENLGNIKFMKFVGQSMAPHINAPDLKQKLTTLAETGRSGDGEGVLEALANLLSNPENFNENSPLAQSLVNVVGKLVYNKDDQIKEALGNLYDAHPENQKLQEGARDLHLNQEKPTLSKQKDALQNIDELSLTRSAFHAIANRGDDSNQGNVVLIKKGNKLSLSPIDDGETHSPKFETNTTTPYWDNVANLFRPLGGKNSTPEELAYRQEILSLDINREVQLFKNTLAHHNEPSADFAPEMYRARLNWIKACVSHNVAIDQITSFRIVQLVGQRAHNLTEQNNALPEQARLSQADLDKRIDRESALMAKIHADTGTKLNMNQKQQLFHLVAQVRDNNPQLSENDLKKLTENTVSRFMKQL